MQQLTRHLALGLLLLPTVALAAPIPDTHELRLDNGLKIVVREDHRAPIVAAQLWYKVGSSYESPGDSGLSHALEHMLFQGSSKVCPGQAFPIMERLGARINAFTNHDTTTYEYLMPRHALGVALEIMADQMSTAHLSPVAFKREIEVIKNERSQNVDDTPAELLDEKMRSIAFTTSGYRTSVVGWQHDLERMSVRQLQDWYATWYVPNNATLVVVGDVTSTEVETLARRYFAGVPSRELPETRQPLELNAPGERRITLRTRNEFPSLVMAFNVPSLTTATNPHTAYTLRLLNELLGVGPSSRIFSQLKFQEERITRARSTYEAFNRGDGLLTIAVDLDIQSNPSLDDIQARLWALLEALKKTPVSALELDRARTRVLAKEVFARDSVEAQAQKLGTLESVGLSWRQQEQEQDLLKAVTPLDIQKAAQTYFVPERLSVALAIPGESHDE
ncbi:peptidase M16 [Pseudomonas agarici]|uniref:Peptidase M16 n=1 Tax=Pseudomonas agarici TaxID=46677 RepID=A0A0X1SVY8_PSEAA|nr:pitrilysin family protein [Pseudomonas agarici]AMB84094.1 peptidase M16 [Pseudomonas agarici]NWB91274.1 insulinase family protein [Pseudomonas agarici]NWC08041.1 insulinase family protein [Pseudomonas agarici]SEL17140.1 zinc protease [Pseudomonas agarici]